MEQDIIYNENCLTGLSRLPDDSVDCCVTSPPYWGLRSYLPDEVKIRDDISDELKEKIKKDLTILGINGIIRL